MTSSGRQLRQQGESGITAPTKGGESPPEHVGVGKWSPIATWAALDSELQFISGQLTFLEERLKIQQLSMDAYASLFSALLGRVTETQRSVQAFFEREDSQKCTSITAVTLEETRRSLQDAQNELIDKVECAIVEVKQELVERIKSPRHDDRCAVVNEVIALQALVARYQPRVSPPLLTPSSMSASTLQALIQVVEGSRPRVALECGSGVSTTWLAYAFEGANVQFRSLDHLSEYAERTREELETHSLGSADTVRLAPLETVVLGDDAFDWYAKTGWEDMGDIDLLVIDGPPGTVHPSARYPALPLLASRLSEGAHIAIDDVNRSDERSIVDRWFAEFPALRFLGGLGDRGLLMRWSPREAPTAPD